jgi:hypothetical protein
LLGGCSSWTPLRRCDGYTIYARSDPLSSGAAEVEDFALALEPAYQVVTRRLGPFCGHVRVHIWDMEEEPGLAFGSRGLEAGDAPLEVRAFHLRQAWFSLHPSGVFLSAPQVSAAIHELVHARLFELEQELPLWFEEGLAMLIADGALFEGRWIADGLVCWPLSELRQQDIDPAELARILALTPEDITGMRDNLLVHFVGWAIVFDLFCEDPQGSWPEWLQRFEAAPEPTREARFRLARTMNPDVEESWLARLKATDPGMRLAAAKGTWKLHSQDTAEWLLDALEIEPHPEVRVALAVNALLSGSRSQLNWSEWARLRREALPALAGARLSDERELHAIRRWHACLRDARDELDEPLLQAFERLWAE